MSRKTIARKPVKNDRIRREKDPIPWRYCLTTLACGLFLVVGFFGAARQHFSSIDLGYQNSKLKKQVEDLESENRRLLLNKEIALSPGEIKKYAKKIGMVELSASNIEIFSTREEPNTPKAKSAKPLITKTVDSKPADKAVVATTASKSAVTTSARISKDGKTSKNAEPKSDIRERIVK